MDIEGEDPRLRMVSGLLVSFCGPLHEQSHCHICLDSWHSTNEDDITCEFPVRIDHQACQCRNIVMGRSCVTSWLLEKDTCPMCRADLVGAHLRNRPPTIADDDEDNAENEDEEYTEDDGLEAQSWLCGDGNYIHSAKIESGELIEANDIVQLFLHRELIEALKTEGERLEVYSSMGIHSASVWEAAYQELVRGRPQVIYDLFTVHGPVCIEGVPTGEDDDEDDDEDGPEL